jgi:hypothetical protein
MNHFLTKSKSLIGRRKYVFLLLVFFSCISTEIFAQTLEGYVLSNTGDTLYFASVFIEEKGKGVSANAQGRYQLNLEKGEHRIRVQYIGYQSYSESVRIDSGQTLRKDFILRQEADSLREVEVFLGKEDPAMDIMRKAIAKRRYHRSLYASYSAEVYVKGTGVLLKAPAIIRKQLERDGLSMNRAFTVESRSIVNFRQPDSLSEKVIAIRTVGDDRGITPGRFINASFYDDNISGVVSPLSDRAMSVYRFAYRGTFEDEGRTIYRIGIIPRRPGEDTFTGTLYLVEDTYAIYSTDVTTFFNGIEVNLKQVYRPVKGPCWLPIQHRVRFNGKIFGVAFEANYLANVDRYEVQLDSAVLALNIRLDAQLPTDTVDSPKKVRRQLKKQTRTEHQEPEVIIKREFLIDTLAFDHDLNFWEENRPVPLTDLEVEGYAIADSLALIEKEKEDSTSSAFTWPEIFFGGRYKLSEKASFRWHSPLALVEYNSIEGVVFQARTSLGYRPDSLEPLRYSFTWNHRYGLSSDRYFWYMRADRRLSTSSSFSTWALEGGHTVKQFNRENPIHPIANSLHTWIASQNLIKLFRQKYVRVEWEGSATRKWDVSVYVEAAERAGMPNAFEHRRFTSNLDDRVIQTQVLHGGGSFLWRPGLKYREYNQVRRPIMYNAPRWELNWRSGVYSDGEAFLHTEIRHGHFVNVFWNDELNWNFTAGRMFGNPDFPDWHHFLGNRSIFSPSEQQFFLLPYYDFSTTGNYFTAMFDYEFSKLFITRSPYAVMMLGLTEHLGAKTLIMEGNRPYYEIGYSLKGILRTLRLDVAYSNLGYRWGVMLGLGGIISFE